MVTKIFSLLVTNLSFCTSEGSCSTYQEEEGYEFVAYLDKGSCDEEEEYQPISEGEEESEESTKALEQECAYKFPTLPKIILQGISPSDSINTSTTNTVNHEQGSPTSPNFVSNVPTTNTMLGAHIKLPIFNGKGLEDLEQHWLLCEFVCTL